jgi:hypothetical protein
VLQHLPGVHDCGTEKSITDFLFKYYFTCLPQNQFLESRTGFELWAFCLFDGTLPPDPPSSPFYFF